jgi:hypothetical protein
MTSIDPPPLAPATPHSELGTRNSELGTRLTHLDEQGNARMVDVGDKAETERVAVARGAVLLSRRRWNSLRAAPRPRAMSSASRASLGSWPPSGPTS